jgi:diguanylate cyclase (GGDEF)-like protein
VRRERASTPIESLVCVPLLARGEPIGAMTATSTRLAAFDRDALDVLSFVAKTIALDIENVRLRRVAVTDALTGCFNRELLQQRLAVELALAGQRESPLSVALVDVDHFKAINDRHGHDVGDKVLVVIADRLRSAIRADDVLVRYGGDEFLALLPNTAVAVAREIGARMRERMEESGVQTDGRSITTRVSVGVAEYHGVSPDALLRRVDAALYAAKRGGRNRVEVAE